MKIHLKEFILEYLASSDLKSLLIPNRQIFQSEMRPIVRDQGVYYFEEFILSNQRKDFILAVIGQILLQKISKK